ncbi:hypothetical protein DL239_10485 [Sedimentitalea sp. CY04]|uniref:Uncharacterized protein n=1 Tax=Parasedimentitalea denitrificans TaxID=2211118 RepID=A0ABX0W730_9RHOB|nr:hypothetical protein [Sedimentitalea sp. CY04]
MRTGIKPRVLNVVSARPYRIGTLFQVPGVSVPAVIAIDRHSYTKVETSNKLTARCLRNALIDTLVDLVRPHI